MPLMRHGVMVQMPPPPLRHMVAAARCHLPPPPLRLFAGYFAEYAFTTR